MDNSQLYYRQMSFEDKPSMQALCLECFPLEYPDSWFDDLLKGDEWTYAQGAYELATDRMVGMIVGQIQTLNHLENEYGYVVDESSSADLVMYITIFGVSETYRRHGVGSNLMQSLLQYVHTQTMCKVVYLHVEAANETAIRFYENRGFTCFCTHKGYYSIEETPGDGLVYLQYANDGKPYKTSLENWWRRVNPFSQRRMNPFSDCLEGPFKFIQRQMSAPS